MSTQQRLQRWRRDDWQIPVVLRKPDGTPIDLTGYTIGAEFTPGGGSLVFSDLTMQNGGIDGLDATHGAFRVLVARLLTTRCPVDVDPLSNAPTFVRLYYLDTLLRRQTFGVVAFQVFDGALTPNIDESGGVVVMWQDASFTIQLGLPQGPAGPSSIAAMQITDAGSTGIALLRAGSAAAARGILGTIAVGATDVQDADYSATPSDFFVRVLALTAQRNITLPSPSLYPKGQLFKIGDFSGACSPNTPINLIAPNGATIAGAPNYGMASAFERLELDHNGKDTWIF